MRMKLTMYSAENLTVEQCFQRCLLAVTGQGVAEKTLQTYLGHFRSLSRYLDTTVPISQLTKTNVDMAVAGMRTKGLSINSISSYIRTFRSFLNWCRTERDTAVCLSRPSSPEERSSRPIPTRNWKNCLKSRIQIYGVFLCPEYQAGCGGHLFRHSSRGSLPWHRRHSGQSRHSWLPSLSSPYRFRICWTAKSPEMRPSAISAQRWSASLLGASERDIITDKESGKDLDRPGYQALKNAILRPGDTLVVKSLDRLFNISTVLEIEPYLLLKFRIEK